MSNSEVIESVPDRRMTCESIFQKYEFIEYSASKGNTTTHAFEELATGDVDALWKACQEMGLEIRKRAQELLKNESFFDAPSAGGAESTANNIELIKKHVAIVEQKVLPEKKKCEDFVEKVDQDDERDIDEGQDDDENGIRTDFKPRSPLAQHSTEPTSKFQIGLESLNLPPADVESPIEEIVHDVLDETLDRIILRKLVQDYDEGFNKFEGPDVEQDTLKCRFEMLRKFFDFTKNVFCDDTCSKTIFEGITKQLTDQQNSQYYKLMYSTFQQVFRNFDSEKDILSREVKGVEECDSSKVFVPRTAVIFKTEPSGCESDPYVKALEGVGITGYLVPTLEVEILEVIELQKALRFPEQYAGLIFSSVRAVQAVKKNLESTEEKQRERVLKVWSQKKNFAVFKTTAAVAKSELGIETIGHEAGCMSNLISIIDKCENPDGHNPYLYPCSYLADRRLLNAVPDLKIKTIYCYKPVPHQNSSEVWSEICTKIEGYPEYLIFFSPSGVTFAAKMFHSLYCEPIFGKTVAIGPSTALKLSECGAPPPIVAKTPNSEGIAEAIYRHIHPLLEEGEAEMEGELPDVCKITDKYVKELRLEKLLTKIKAVKPEALDNS